ncbi:MAG: aminotransferase class I/II-fold pyridoxal phosphate-dependent enzyme [Bacteroidota bacterium]|nr:aminotransferase class I/II-fold pyridoxal phosphate-dependent enzyme [Bacteroidota bacterium]
MDKSEKVWLSPPYLHGNEEKIIKNILREGWIAPNGPQNQLFEQAISRYCRTSQCLTTITGTAAIHLALKAIGIKKGDIVFVPAFSFAATVNPVFYLEAIPHYIDCEPRSWGMDPDILEEELQKSKSNKKLPKAIVIVHAYGQVAEIEHICAIADHFKIPVIEDAAAAMGSTLFEKQAGTFGIAGVFSFNGNKIITTSQGGALISDDEKLISDAKTLSSQAKIPGQGFNYSSIGYNYTLSNVLATIGLSQIQNIEFHISQKRKIFELYRKELEPLGVKFLEEPEDNYWNRWLTNAWFRTSTYEKVKMALNINNIDFREVWKPLPKISHYQSNAYSTHKVSDYINEHWLSLPCGVGITESDLEKVIQIIKQNL